MAVRDKPILSPILVGRTLELETLDRALLTAKSGTGKCLLIAGEAGVGKSRLLAEVRQHAAMQHWLILQGNCFEQDLSFPYAPWIDMLRALFVQRPREDIRELLGPLASEFVALLPELASRFPKPQPAATLDPEAEKRRRFETLVQFLVQQSQAQPLVVMLEDLHWSDETSLELFHLCARRLAAHPVLLIGTYRREDKSPHLMSLHLELNRERLSEEIVLAPLTGDQVTTLVKAIFEIERPIGRDFLDVIMSLSEGNPFYIEEILKALVERGDIFYKEGKWERRLAAELHVPLSVQEAVRQRTESLRPQVRRILALAAVAGQRFDFGLLQAIVSLDETELLQAIKELIAAQLIVEESPDQFAFRHALTREAICATLLGHERRALHQRIGETLERVDANGPERELHVASLAYHFYHAEAWDKALAYSRRAGEKAQALYAPREALDHFSHALDGAQRLGITPPFELLRARAKAYETLGNFEHARGDFEAALECARRSDDRHGEWQITLDLGFLWAAHDYAQSGAHLLRALDTARQLGDPTIQGHTLNRVGNWHLNRDEPSKAEQYHQEALQIFRGLNDPQGVAETLELLGVTSYAGANVVQGLDYSEQEIPLFRQVGDRQGLINCLIHLTLSAQFDVEVSAPGDIADLIHPGEEALRLAREMGWRTGEAVVLVNLAHCLTPAGEFSRALDVLGAAAAIGEEINHRIVILISHWLFGQVYHNLLAFSEARQHLEQAMVSAEASNSGLYARASAADLCLACISQNDLERAETLLGAVLDDGPTGSRHLRACWNARAELALAQGDPTYALKIADDLLASSPNIGNYGTRGIPRVSELRGRALAALGRPDEAEAALLDAREGALEQGRRPLLWRAHVNLGKLYRQAKRGEKAEQEFAAARTLVHDLAAPLSEGILREKFLERALAMIPAPRPVSPRQAIKQEFGGLTAREREVAVLIAQGKSNAAIAEALVTSKRTVEKHVGSILSKLGLSSRAQIVAWAIEKGLTRPAK